MATEGAGESAMIALAMLKAKVPAADPSLAACLAKVRSRFNSSVSVPERSNGQGRTRPALPPWPSAARTRWATAASWR